MKYSQISALFQKLLNIINMQKKTRFNNQYSNLAELVKITDQIRFKIIIVTLLEKQQKGFK